jgi:hypothetical protein
LLPISGSAQFNGCSAGFCSPPQTASAPTWNPQTSPACQVVGFASSSVTFTGVPMGTGTVVVGVADDQPRTYTAVTINGNTGNAASTTSGAGLWYATNTGSSGNITITASGALDTVCIAVGYFTNLNSSTPTCSGSCPNVTYAFPSTPVSLGSLTVSSGGFGIAFAATSEGSTVTPLIWTNATRDASTEVDNTTGNGLAIGMAHLVTTGNPNFSCTTSCSNHGIAMAGAAWR